ncbi:MAG: hypothetical protein CMK09_18020 [Ponticaulis sp.]|nr:hypothetical protein [Ponticaulis sp.]|tara:strand:+ start:30622 stop:30975 length:354 start_codon:yes stop_codon:yes gene_type:complete
MKPNIAVAIVSALLAACGNFTERQMVIPAPPESIMSEEALDEINITIVIHADNEISINDTPIAVSSVRSKLTELQAEIETLKILVMADPKTNNKVLNKIVDAAREFGDVGFTISSAQ